MYYFHSNGYIDIWHIQIFNHTIVCYPWRFHYCNIAVLATFFYSSFVTRTEPVLLPHGTFMCTQCSAGCFVTICVNGHPDGSVVKL